MIKVGESPGGAILISIFLQKITAESAIASFKYNISISIDMSSDMPSDLNLFRALGEETKHRILRLLLSGEHCACQIPKKIGRTQSNTSMHLAKLLEWNLIKYRRDGKMIIYSIKDDRVKKIFKMLGKR